MVDRDLAAYARLCIEFEWLSRLVDLDELRAHLVCPIGFPFFARSPGGKCTSRQAYDYAGPFFSEFRHG